MDVENIGNGEHTFRTQFVTSQFLFYISACIVSAWILLKTINVGNPAGIVMVPIMVLLGHLYFWSLAISRGHKIKNFFLMKLGPE